MILYFSGTGNSKFIAEQINKQLNDEVVYLNDLIKNNEIKSFDNVEKLIFVLPTYGWRIPNIVADYISKANFKENALIYFVMNCGGEISNAPYYNKKLALNKHLIYKGTAQIIMPENYIAMFDAPKWDEALNIINSSLKDIDEVATLIKDNKDLIEPKIKFKDKLNSSLVHHIFTKYLNSPKKFICDNNCIGCKKCEALCPLNNIKIINNKPVWGNKCCHCMACICNCPVHAIEYGKATLKREKYLNKLTKL